MADWLDLTDDDVMRARDAFVSMLAGIAEVHAGSCDAEQEWEMFVDGYFDFRSVLEEMLLALTREPLAVSP